MMECFNSFKLYCVMCTNVKCTIVCSSSAKSLFFFSSTVTLSSLFFKTQKSHLHSDQTLKAFLQLAYVVVEVLRNLTWSS